MTDMKSHSGATQLTHRELQCLEALAGGLSNDGIAKRLEISLATVALHLGNARRKLGAKTREHAVAVAVKYGLVELRDWDEQMRSN